MEKVKRLFGRAFQNNAVRVTVVILTVILVAGMVAGIAGGMFGGNVSNSSRSYTIVVADCDTLTDWRNLTPSNHAISNDISKTGTGSLLTVLDGSYEGKGKGYKIEHLTVETTDVSDMTHIGFDFYISDAEQAENLGRMHVEVGSNWLCDHEELEWSGNLTGLKNGWNHIELELEIFSKKFCKGCADYYHSPNPFDSTSFRHFRLFTSEPFEADNLTVAVDNIYFTNRPCGEMVS